MNALGYAALVLWIPLSLLAFASLRPPVAALVCLLGGAMFLPCGAIDLPLFPQLGKEEFTSLACLLGCLVFAPARLRRIRPWRGPELLVVVMLVGSVFTYATNRDPLVTGPTLRPGSQPTDLLVPGLWLVWGVPFLVGRALFRRSQDLRLLLRALVLAALVYSLFVLIELRLSPQFHRWVYGYHQHAFVQTIRGSGYRPMVFMAHGLVLSLFVALCLIASVALARARQTVLGLSAGGIALYLGALLVLCKSAGALAYAALALPPLLLLSPGRLARGAALVGCLVLAYPALRSLDLLPVETVLGVAADLFDSERASSLQARLYNEKEVLDRATERLFFGWSGYARPQIWDPVTGQNQTTFDGYWALAIGEGGIVRFGSIFVLLLLPVFRAPRAIARVASQRDRWMLAGLSLIVAVRVLNQIPNTAIDPYLTLLSGALAGSLEGLAPARQRRRRAPRPVGAGRGESLPAAAARSGGGARGSGRPGAAAER